MQENGTGALEAPATRTLKLGEAEVEVTIERVTGRKASRAFAIIREVSDKVPELVQSWARFRRDFERDNAIELDRAQALLRYGTQPMVRDGVPILYPEGHARAGEPMMAPSPLDSITAADWEASGGKLRLPKTPDLPEQVGAIFHEALDVAEEQIYALLALLTMPNDDVKDSWKAGTLKDDVDQRVEEVILDAYADELLELAVVCGELVEEQFVAKVRRLGGRVGNALRLVGIDPAALTGQTQETPQTPQEEGQTPSSTTSSPEISSSTPSSSTPASSTDSPASTGGPSTPPSTPPTSSSSPSDDGSSSSGPS